MKNIFASGLLLSCGLFAAAGQAADIQNVTKSLRLDNALGFSQPSYPPPGGGYGPPPGGGYGPPPPPPPGYGGQCASGFSYVDPNRSFHGDIVTSLTNYYNLNQICAGRRLQQVIVYAVAQPSATVSVEINGYQYGYAQQMASDTIREYDFYFDPNQSQIGYQVRDLSLRFIGNEYIQRMGFILD